MEKVKLNYSEEEKYTIDDISKFIIRSSSDIAQSLYIIDQLQKMDYLRIYVSKYKVVAYLHNDIWYLSSIDSLDEENYAYSEEEHVYVLTICVEESSYFCTMQSVTMETENEIKYVDVEVSINYSKIYRLGTKGDITPRQLVNQYSFKIAEDMLDCIDGDCVEYDYPECYEEKLKEDYDDEVFFNWEDIEE